MSTRARHEGLAKPVNGIAAAVGLLALSALPLTVPDDAAAQEWPSKQIKLIVTLSPGSASDSVARVVSDQIGQQLGQQIIVENRAGGGGTIGANAVAKAEPDGYTLLLNTNLHTLAPAIIANVPYDTERDFAGITLLGISPHVLIISAEQNIKTLQEFVAAVKTRPNGMTYASVVGSGTHLNGAHFVQQMKLDARMVPFKGAPEAITEVMTNRVDIYFSPILPTLSLMKDGKIHGLGITSEKRSGVLPDMPTTREAGYPDSTFGLMFGLFAPAKTPRPVIDKLHAETAKALANPAIAAKLKGMGVDVGADIMTPVQFDAYIKAQIKTEGEQARAAGLGKQ